MQDRTMTAQPVETARLTAPEAVRRAIAALGYRAEVTEILDYVREHFGIGVPDREEVASPVPVLAAVKQSPQPAEEAETARKPVGKRGKGKE